MGISAGSSRATDARTLVPGADFAYARGVTRRRGENRAGRRIEQRPMDLHEFLSPAAVATDLRAPSKKALLQQLAHRAAALTGLDERRVIEVILERERLGSTGFGGGVAIPHGKIEGLGGVFGLFARLGAPIDYDALDRQPVDLVFLLLAPQGAGADHLKALASVSRTFRDRTITAKLRGSTSADALYAMLASGAHSRAA
jgi:nitrogen PTS system EIIA component